MLNFKLWIFYFILQAWELLILLDPQTKLRKIFQSRATTIWLQRKLLLRKGEYIFNNVVYLFSEYRLLNPLAQGSEYSWCSHGLWPKWATVLSSFLSIAEHFLSSRITLLDNLPARVTVNGLLNATLAHTFTNKHTYTNARCTTDIFLPAHTLYTHISYIVIIYYR